MSVSNDEIIIEQDDLKTAQYLCNNIEKATVRNRAMANIVGVQVAEKYLLEYNVDIETGIHNVGKVLEDIDIADIYINGNYIDVRVYFEDGQLFVPKSHFELGVLPVAYMFVKLDKEVSAAEVTGFVFPDDIEIESEVKGYYLVSEDILKSFYDVEPRLAIVEDNGFDNLFKKSVYSFLSGTLFSKSKFYSTLIASGSSREYLNNAANAEVVFSELATAATEESYDNSLSEADDSNDLTEPDILEPEGELQLDMPDDTEFLEPSELSEDLNNLSEEEILEDIDEISEEDSLSETDDLLDTSEASTDLSIDGEPVDTELSGTEEVIEDLSISDESEIVDFTESDVITEDLEVGESDDILSDGSANNELFDAENAEEFVSDDTVSESPDYIAETEENENGQDVIEKDETVSEPDDFEELSKFDYSTEIMPSINTIENSEPEVEVTEKMLEEADNYVQPQEQEPQTVNEDNEQIDVLFNNKQQGNNVKKKKGSPIPFLGFLVVIGALGYYGYTKFFASMPDINRTQSNTNTNIKESNIPVKTELQKEEPMPIESVENTDLPKQTDAVSVAIPAIEQNLEASVDVSNLNVTWEVPVGYANNATAKRYFVKMGKVLQLSLKTELLTISNSPITNKMSVELVFDKTGNKFNISKMIDSSGVENIDRLIQDTINRVLEMNMNMNTGVFGNLQGNPVLIIKL